MIQTVAGFAAGEFLLAPDGAVEVVQERLKVFMGVLLLVTREVLLKIRRGLEIVLCASSIPYYSSMI